MRVIEGWEVLNFYTAFLLILLLVFKKRGTRLKMGRMYTKLLLCTLVLIFAETIARIGEMRGGSQMLIAYIGNLIMFLLDPVDILFAVSYVDCWMDEKSRHDRMIFRQVFQLFVLLNTVLVLADQIFGLRWFFYFEGGIYHRGQFFLVRALILELFIVFVSFYALLFRNSILPEYKNTLYVLPVFAMVGSIIQIFISSLNATYAGLTMACLILFIYYQNNDVNVDYLTGVLNRRGLDIKLEDMIAVSMNGGAGFSALMLDVDHFKDINDTLGHEAGDEAIKTVAEILLHVFGEEAAIGRFGGDEFCVISHNCSEEDLKQKIEEVRNSLDKARIKNGWDDNVGISCGYDIFDPEKGQSAEDFAKHIDELMYGEKQEHHKKD